MQPSFTIPLHKSSIHCVSVSRWLISFLILALRSLGFVFSSFSMLQQLHRSWCTVLNWYYRKLIIKKCVTTSDLNLPHRTKRKINGKEHFIPLICLFGLVFWFLFFSINFLWCLYCMLLRLKNKLTGRFISRNKLQQQHDKVTEKLARLYFLA